ncbi:putative acetyltransferase (GNAT) family protein [Lyophyllum shimeji]|uniref:Acetyltransferase (GNAT) family protein n=1 Tax=Lyophyllum shimeji TaxID=47721 RepID=A0A9P3PK60_LYOSH|nr:putative acetyltransferase (GNAT) family protein [Lyophyllum shimeji]
MSAYGSIKRSTQDSAPLPASIWPVQAASDHGAYVSVHHLTLSTAQHLEGLLDYLNAVFAQEVEDGLTYPQEGEMGRSTFEAYFFSADVFVGMVGSPGQMNNREGEVDLDIEVARGGRPWDQCVAGFYYIKPNYPGRSSHICNAGFVVPPTHRGKKYGHVLANSYVKYAPMLGYRASVFNLVYVNNLASIKLWERLGFTKAGLIPRAGRLKRRDGQGEEYVDAFVFYKSFVEDEGTAPST